VEGARVLSHELVHAIAGSFGGPLYGASVCPGLIEGLAEALEEGMDREPARHDRAAAALDKGWLPRPEEFIGPLAFGSSGMRRSYDSAGSFCGYLLYAYGPEPFREAYCWGTLEEAYGKTIPELGEEWRAFLRGVPFDEEALEAASHRFDPAAQPPFYSTKCPRVGELSARIRELQQIQRRGRKRAAEGYVRVALREGNRVAYLRALGLRLGVDYRLGRAMIAARGLPESWGVLSVAARAAGARGEEELREEALERLRATGVLSEPDLRRVELRARLPAMAHDPLAGAESPAFDQLLLALRAEERLSARREVAERLAADPASSTEPYREAMHGALVRLAREELEAGRLEDSRKHLAMARELAATPRELDVVSHLTEVAELAGD
jgi:hypothetical protein